MVKKVDPQSESAAIGRQMSMPSSILRRGTTNREQVRLKNHTNQFKTSSAWKGNNLAQQRQACIGSLASDDKTVPVVAASSGRGSSATTGTSHKRLADNTQHWQNLKRARLPPFRTASRRRGSPGRAHRRAAVISSRRVCIRNGARR